MGVIPAGSSMTWTEKQAVSVRLGNPGGVVLTVNGKRQTPGTVLPVTLSFSPQRAVADAPPIWLAAWVGSPCVFKQWPSPSPSLRPGYVSTANG